MSAPLAAALVLAVCGAPNAAAETWRLEAWEQLLDYTSPSRPLDYRPLDTAARPWRLCALYPHLKDSYWLSVNAGMVEQARRLGVALTVKEAGGYGHAEGQREQLKECADGRADAIILGSVSADRLTPAVVEIGRRIPVLATVNQVRPEGIVAMAGVDWYRMGYLTGRVLAERHPKGSLRVRVALFPGPKGDGGSDGKMRGFTDALGDAAVEIAAVRHGDTGKLVQLSLIEDVLEAEPSIDYIVGAGVAAEAAMGALRARGLQGRIHVVADYFTHGVYRGIKRGHILAAPTDQPLLQGRISIDQAVRVLEGRPVPTHVGPDVILVTRDTVDGIDLAASLSPADFKPTFGVPAPGAAPGGTANDRRPN
ncbi:TMAO reductase system periplasmic protein TorT [Azospirillum sp. TSO22-1]|uniref:TMAO reductase system periplasmic protein TorT n=1 Tax=Azospirillum sp. TSO22-1 TaxID=716789 RepID=UPI0018EE879F|nr:TMAO reductase system periplasmic protein TorT [Azospirillum sp. TSO22-1]